MLHQWLFLKNHHRIKGDGNIIIKMKWATSVLTKLSLIIAFNDAFALEPSWFIHILPASNHMRYISFSFCSVHLSFSFSLSRLGRSHRFGGAVAVPPSSWTGRSWLFWWISWTGGSRSFKNGSGVTLSTWSVWLCKFETEKKIFFILIYALFLLNLRCKMIMNRE